MPADQLVYPFSETTRFLGSSAISDYISRYLTIIEAKTIVVERDYIDKDYLIDFSKFYSRSFNIDKKRTTRVHFFDHIFSNEEFQDIVMTGDPQKIEQLNEHYLGFSVVKPIQDQNQKDLIGRTLLKTYRDEENDFKRKYLRYKHEISLFGIKLVIDSLPYQTQDSAVGGCATIACWIVLQQLSYKFELERASLFEITEKSVHIPTIGRNFPSHGLTMEQIKSFFDAINLETEFILPSIMAESQFYDPKVDCFVEDAIKAYLELGVPILVGIALQIKDENRSFTRKIIDILRSKKIDLNFKYHAAVVTGYKSINKRIIELYLHDDGIGPYCKTLPVNGFYKWNNEWISRSGYTAIHVQTLLIPLYPKIRLPFKEIYIVFLGQKRGFEAWNRELGIDPSLYNAELFLMDIRQYKQFLLKENFVNKLEIMLKSFPRFLWVIRHNYGQKPFFDFLIDATDVYANKAFQVIVFNYPVVQS
ncbi:MAG: hypothetical protein ABR887_07440 [Methanoregulaceae archaeon]|jgi:hypothetical protein